jgi:hypothetical protein
VFCPFYSFNLACGILRKERFLRGVYIFVELLPSSCSSVDAKSKELRRRTTQYDYRIQVENGDRDIQLLRNRSLGLQMYKSLLCFWTSTQLSSGYLRNLTQIQR